MKNISTYNIGLDIGTNSVGYAATDENGNLLKFKGKNMWGVNLFDAGVSAKSTRLARCSRRRIDRRKNRINLLQKMLNDDILSVDDTFFIRLAQSSLWNEDREFKDIYTLFNNKDFNEVDYYKAFPTVYHLRKYLMTCDEKADIRLIYLALHHIVKYRGNFLYEDQKNISAENSQLSPAVMEFLELFNNIYEIENIDELTKQITDVLISTEIKKSDKVNNIVSIFNPTKEEKNIFKNIANAMVGYKADFKLIFNIESEENLKFALSSDDADIKLNDLLDNEQIAAYELLQKIYSAFVLAEILKGDDVKCISDAMINKYQKHADDLELLKRLFKSHFPDEYNFMFRGKKDSNNKYIKDDKKKSYTSYILGEKCCSKEELYVTIKKIIEKKSDELSTNIDYQYCINEIENDTFLPKINSKDNLAIPYQLHLEELEKIIDNQGKYYNDLIENKSKISSIVSFRIPYYVGPLNEKKNPDGSKQFAWMVRKVEEEKIYPWNFEDIVDVEASAEKFITRMTNKCTYLPDENVISKCSLLYSEYEVLNEIKQIKVDGKFLSLEIKKDLFENIFKRSKSVSESALRKWLVNEKKYPKSIEITGFQKENKFASSLTSYIDFSSSNIFGKIDNSNIDMIENLILWITLFEDKKILKRKIKNEYPQISDDKLEKICKLRYKGWSRLSQKLLDEISITNKQGEKQTIIDTMRNTNKNFMQIITSDELGFKKLIAEESKPKGLAKITNDVIDNLAGSPAIKRGIKQSAAVVEEIVSIMKANPAHIYIEFAREEGQKKRTQSRYSKVEKLYENIKKDPDFRKVVDELKKTEKKALDDRMVYLYFIQNGKSMYSGKSLEISSLSRTCQIDHIIPQSYIKDDSFDNLALVLSGENQEKSDKMLISSKIISSQRGFWRSLLNNKLISEKKFNNLTRDTSFDEKELKGFINRQLVETRQIIKHVANLFGAVYASTEIVEIKAELSSNLRKQYGLYKNREINDYHHAHDAYIASIIGRYVSVCYPHLKDEFDYSAYKKFVSKIENLKNNKYGYIVGDFKSLKVDKRTGELIWNGEHEVEHLRKCLNYKDCYISKKVERQTGEFYKQTIYKKDSRDNTNLLPLKANLPVGKYGGYSSPSQAYSVVIEYDGKKKREKKLVGIPIHIVKLENTKPKAIYDFLLSNGYQNPKILKDRIMKYQKLTYEGKEYYISSSSEVHNARQLILPLSCNEIIYKINSPKYVEEINDQHIIALYDILCEKIKCFYPCFEGAVKKLEDARNDFENKSKKEKIAIINQILIMLHANPSNGNFAKYKLGNLKDREGRMAGKNLDIDKIIFVSNSVTGLFENRCYGKDL